MKNKKYPRHGFPPARKVVKFWLQTGKSQGEERKPEDQAIFDTGKGCIFTSINTGRSSEPILEKQAFF